jgi:hypothetical protein
MVPLDRESFRPVELSLYGVNVTGYDKNRERGTYALRLHEEALEHARRKGLAQQPLRWQRHYQQSCQ